jgi:predicted Rossmann fold nucleotide-binding protein DprA/Smf involved in DNA uptake
LVATSDDILEEWGISRSLDSSRGKEPRDTSDLSRDARQVLSVFGEEDRASVDELALKARLSVQDVLKTLMELEMKGMVVRASDARFARAIR